MKRSASRLQMPEPQGGDSPKRGERVCRCMPPEPRAEPNSTGPRHGLKGRRPIHARRAPALNAPAVRPASADLGSPGLSAVRLLRLGRGSAEIAVITASARRQKSYPWPAIVRNGEASRHGARYAGAGGRRRRSRPLRPCRRLVASGACRTDSAACAATEFAGPRPGRTAPGCPSAERRLPRALAGFGILASVADLLLAKAPEMWRSLDDGTLVGMEDVARMCGRAAGKRGGRPGRGS